MAKYFFSGTTGDDWTSVTVSTPAGQNDVDIVNTNWGAGPNDAASKAVPTSADDVELKTGSPYASVVIGAPEYEHTNQAVDVNSVTIDSGMVLADNTSAVRIRSALTNEGSFAINSGELNFGQAVVENGQTVGGAIQNDGVMSITNAYLGITGNVTLQGSGMIQMTGADLTGAPDPSTNPPDPNIGVLTNYSTITGSGIITAHSEYQDDPSNTLVVNNYGVINADDSSAELTIHLNNGPGGGLTNGGLVEATSGATLYIRGTLVTQTVNGQLGAYGAGSLVQLNSVDLVGGSITGSDGGIVDAGEEQTADNILDGSADHPITIQSGATFQVGNLNGMGGGLFVNGSVVNHGTFKLFSGGHNAEVAIDAAGVTLSGGGKVVLSNNGDYPSQIAGFSTTTATTLHNVDNTFSGAGLIGAEGDSSAPSANLLDFDNQAAGVVDADQSYGALTLKTPLIANAGLLEATNTAGLVLSGTVIDQTGGGIIKADGTGNTVYLQGATIEGGTLTSANGGIIGMLAPNGSFYTDTLDGGSSAGAVTISAAINDTYDLQLSGTIHNSGIVAVQSGAAITIGDADNPDVTLDGGGQIVLTRAYYTSGLNGFDASITATLHNVDNTITGAGVSIGGDYGNGGHGLSLIIDNQAKGVIDADGSATDSYGSEALEIDAATTNAGLIEDTGAAGLVLSRNIIDQTGGGIIKADGASSVVYMQGTTIEGGTLTSTNGGTFETTGPNGGYGGTLDGSTAAGAVTTNAAIDDTHVVALKGTIHNSGTITVESGATFEIGDQPVTLDGGGQILLKSAYYTSGLTGYDPTAAATLHNVDNTISGAGEIAAYYGNGGSATNLILDNQQAGVIDATDASQGMTIAGTVKNAGLIEDTGAAGMSIYSTTLSQTATGIIEANGAGTHVTIATADGDVVNDGTLEANGGTLDVAWVDAVSGGGKVLITNGGTAEFDSSLAGNVSFQGDNAGTLSLASTYSGTISGFARGDTIDLGSFVIPYSYNNATVQETYSGNANGGTLTLSDAGGPTINLEFSGRYSGAQFVLSAGQNNDTLLTLSNTVPSPPTTTPPNDFNGDFMSDLLWQNNNGAAMIWEMNGASVADNTTLGVNPGPKWHEITTGDFNNDGFADILWQNDNGAVSIWEMNGTKVVSNPTLHTNPGPSWHVIGTGDFNDDGKADILWQNTNGAVSIWEMNGTSVIANPTLHTNPGPAWHVIGVGDFNDDGKSDILWQNTNGAVSIWEMNGTSVISNPTLHTNPGPSWHVIDTGDFNNDGKSDILWQNTNGAVSIWEMDGTSEISNPTLHTNPGPAWHVISAADYNGDGKSDITWQNNNGTASIWEMDGTNILHNPTLSPNPGSSWHVIGNHGLTT